MKVTHDSQPEGKEVCQNSASDDVIVFINKRDCGVYGFSFSLFHKWCDR